MGAAVEAVFVEAASATTLETGLAAAAGERGAEVVEVQAGVLSRAVDARTPQAVAAIVGMVDRPLASLAGARMPLAVVCVDLQDPGNAGTLVRAAAGSGAGAVVFSTGAVDLYNPKAVRASAGAVFHVPLVVASGAGEALDELGRWGMRRVATAARGGEDYAAFDLASPTALVFGSESRGLSAEVASHVDATVTVPMDAGTESLNVAMSAAVLCFESARQRRKARR